MMPSVSGTLMMSPLPLLEGVDHGVVIRSTSVAALSEIVVYVSLKLQRSGEPVSPVVGVILPLVKLSFRHLAVVCLGLLCFRGSGGGEGAIFIIFSIARFQQVARA